MIYPGDCQDMSRMWPGCGQDMTMLWPKCVQDVVSMWTGWGQDLTKVWSWYDQWLTTTCPWYWQDVDLMSQWCDQDMAMLWPGCDQYVTGCDQSVTGIWPGCGPYVVRIWPGCDHKVTRIWRMWSWHGHDVAKLWPGCGQVVARIWLYCDQGVGNHKAKWISFIQYYSDTYSNRSCYVTFPFEAKWTWIITRVLSAKRIFDPVSNWVYFVSISKLLSIPKWWLPWHRIVSFAYGEGGLTCLNRKYVYFLLPLLCFRDKLRAVYSRHVLINLHTSSLLWRNTIIFKHQNVSIIMIQLSIACCQLL